MGIIKGVFEGQCLGFRNLNFKVFTNINDLVLPFLKINGELGKAPKSALLAANCHFIHECDRS